MADRNKSGEPAENSKTPSPATPSIAPQAKGAFQFRTGQLMLIFVWVSIMCAVLSAMVGRLKPEHQTMGAIYVLVVIAVFLLFLAWQFVRRSRVERKAGLSHYIARPAVTSWFHIFGIGSCVAALGYVVFLFWVLNRQGDDWTDILLFLNVMLFWGGSSTKYLMTAFWWKIHPRAFDLREHGVLIGTFLFIPWDQLRGWRWNKFTKELRLTTEDNFFEYAVPKNHKEEIEQALSKFIPKVT